MSFAEFLLVLIDLNGNHNLTVRLINLADQVELLNLYLLDLKIFIKKVPVFNKNLQLVLISELW